MVDWSKFKPEVFGSLPVAVLCLMLVIVSISFPYWITNGRAEFFNSNTPNGTNVPSSSLSKVYFGLFEGRKTRERGGSCTRGLKWVCGSGVCMMSCGTTNSDRKKDLDLVLHNTSVTASQGDNDLCDPCKSTEEDSEYFNGGYHEELTSNVVNVVEFQPKPHMVREGMLITVIIMLLVGLLFTFLNIVFTVLNIAHNPVSSIVGIDGLVLWNFISGLMYFLVVVLWGAEFNIKLRTNLCISDTLRPEIDMNSHSSIGWCCLLLLCPMFLHFGMSGLFAWRQYNRYYNKRSKQDREMRINVQDASQGGTDILF